MIKHIELWSDDALNIVPWDVKLEKENAETDIETEVIAVRYNDKVHKFSPNTSDDELKAWARQINEEHK